MGRGIIALFFGRLDVLLELALLVLAGLVGGAVLLVLLNQVLGTALRAFLVNWRAPGCKFAFGVIGLDGYIGDRIIKSIFLSHFCGSYYFTIILKCNQI